GLGLQSGPLLPIRVVISTEDIVRLRSAGSVFLLVAGLGLLSGSALNAQVSITTGNPPNSALNMPYGFTIGATENCGYCNYPIFSFSLSEADSGTFPTWLTIDSETGALTGTPTSSGPYTFSITVSDTNNDVSSVTQAYTITVSGTSEVLSVL